MVTAVAGHPWIQRHYWTMVDHQRNSTITIIVVVRAGQLSSWNQKHPRYWRLAAEDHLRLKERSCSCHRRDWSAAVIGFVVVAVVTEVGSWSRRHFVTTVGAVAIVGSKYRWRDLTIHLLQQELAEQQLVLKAGPLFVVGKHLQRLKH